MFIRAAADHSTALNYLLTTTPSPLEITPAGTTPTPATITVTAANPDSDPVRVVSVKFTLIGGAGAGALTEHPEQIHLTVTPAADWTFTRDGDGSFLAVPAGDHQYVEVTDKAVLFELTNIAVNAELGVTTVDITERTQDAGNDPVRGSMEFQVGKCNPGFQFGDLQPTILDGGRTSFDNGEKVTLSWTASYGAIYTMLHQNRSYDVTNVRTWTTPEPVHQDATFHLRASLTTDGRSVTHYLHTTVTVDRPDLTINTLNAQGALTAGGAVTVNGLLTAKNDLDVSYGNVQKLTTSGTAGVRLIGPVAAESTVTVGGAATLNSTLTSYGTLTSHGDLEVVAPNGGRSKLTTVGVAGVHVVGPLTADDSVTIGGALTVGGAATLRGDLAANGNLTAVGADKVVRIRDLRGPAGVGRITINDNTDVNGATNVNGLLSAQHDLDVSYGGVRKLTTSGTGAVSFGADGKALFRIWNAPDRGAGPLNVFVDDSVSTDRPVKAYAAAGVPRRGGSFWLQF